MLGKGLREREVDLLEKCGWQGLDMLKAIANSQGAEHNRLGNHIHGKEFTFIHDPATW